ncbi:MULTISPECIES: plastocyanin [Pseudanabaena]|uniref:Plastocyanin n=2 Tax=Pseudanabaena TaxID=1152 RepID=L8MUL2_9CYAN|nr:MULTISPECIES: plastocyanin [Pseudanabaena]ELS31151.1 plastocyanin [Pseudanabaena biceps PCC 7429]MDG3496584.1 plastocyanin [Pseudanabaena catenata USMAC16]
MNISSFAKKLGLAIASLLFVVGSLFMTASPAAADVVTVKMGSDSGQLVFDPKVVTIKVGDTVKWVNNKAFPHNIVFDGHAELSHKKLAQKPKAELESTFNEAGEFSYYCSPHRGAGMQGKVIVQS